MNGEKPIVDLEVLSELREAIGNTTNDIVRLYLDDVPNSLQHMFKALEAADFITVGRLAHSLKSSSANVGAMYTSDLAAKLEAEIKNGLKDSPKILTSIQDLQKSFDQSGDLFREYIKKI